MSIEIKKTGKNTYYRKDGNKMGGRKEKQEVLNISIKHWVTDMAIRHRASSKIVSGWGQFDSIMSGGLRKGEMAMIAAVCDAFPEDHFKSNVALAAVRAADRGKVVMFGIEHEFDHTDRLAEELKVHGKYMPYNRPIQLAYVDGVPYNPMDEFDRPNFYKEKQFIVDMPDSIYPKNPEEVLSEQFKIDVNDTHQKLVTDAINSFVNVNKPYKLVVDYEGRQLYPETSLGINGTTLINMEEVNNMWKKNEDNIGRGSTKPMIFMDITMEELIEMISEILPDGSGYALNDKSTVEGSSFSVSYFTDISKETTVTISGAGTRSEALSNFYTYLRENKGEVKNEK